MAPQKDLAKIGLEGFQILDDNLVRKRQPAKHNRVLSPPKQEPVVSCYEMARKYGGVVITDHSTDGRGFVPQEN